jgi:heptaprenyl diphosphate synthase
MRIGLANLPLMLALDIFSPSAFALLALIKVLGQALITGTLFSYVFLFSLAGTMVSAGAMYLLRRGFGPERIGFTGIGVIGAFLSNASQLALARVFIFGEGAALLAPPFLAAGIITGLTLGLFCEAFAARSAWYRTRSKGPGAGGGVPSPGGNFPAADRPRSGTPPAVDPGPANFPGQAPNAPDGGYGGRLPNVKNRDLFRLKRRELHLRLFRNGELFIAGFIMMGAFLFNPSTVLRVPQFLLFWFFAWLTGKKNKPLITLLVILGIVLFNLLVPYGRVLAEFGSLRITQGSLLGGLRRAVTLEGLIMLSRASVRPDLRLPGPLGSLIGESLRIFEGITERRGLITRKHFIEGIDALLLELSAGQGDREGPPAGEQAAGTPQSLAVPPEGPLPGMLFLAAAAILTVFFTVLGIRGR